jgi:hypothetical protein
VFFEVQIISTFATSRAFPRRFPRAFSCIGSREIVEEKVNVKFCEMPGLGRWNERDARSVIEQSDDTRQSFQRSTLDRDGLGI